ncbi:MAG: family 16 glycoside hydrolase [Verrucomicrobiota bacterium]
MRRFALLCLLLTTALPLWAQPVSLFDGKSLTGWDFDPAVWRVEDGLMTGGSLTEKVTQNYFICTNKNYQNFDLKLKIKCSGDPATGMLNSGIQIRSLRVPGGHHMSGYQVDCGKGWFGKIYDEFRRNKVIAEPLDAAALDKAVDVYGWNEYRIRAEGPRIQVWINGVAAIDYTEADKNVALDGQLGPQVHSGGACLVQVKDITIEELPATPGAPTWQSLGGVEAARKLVAPPAKPQAAAPTKTGRDISYNNVQSTAKTAAEQQKRFHLPEGYDIELVVQESDGIGKFVSVYFDQRGRLWTQTAFEYPVDANENPAAAEAIYNSPGKDKVLIYSREALNAPLPPGGLTNPVVYAEGLAIPLGILPWGNGDTCYIQHGHDLKLFKDTNGDSRADTHEVLLTGFGVQDSHLFPHQFTRAPGGWIWMAQGLFNNSQVHKPGSKELVDYPKCGMARMRPDGSAFEVTSVGPNNIWGLVITGEGETFIQEANDYGYPVMPFHEYAYYPGGMEALKKSYQPDFPPQADFRMGGTGLSGLALIENGPLVDAQAAHTLAVANPITSKVQTLAMHRDGAHWKLEQKPDLITCDDPFFRPVALTNGPDGCLYIVDWYNKIISHNEVPRAHPDRDKTRGRIWRVKPKKTNSPESAPIPDFTQLTTDELIALLGTKPTAKAHLAWQTLADLHTEEVTAKLRTESAKSKSLEAKQIQSLWALQDRPGYPISIIDLEWLPMTSTSAQIRTAIINLLGNTSLYSFEPEGLDAARSISNLAATVTNTHPVTRAQAIVSLGALLKYSSHPSHPAEEALAVHALLSFAKPSLPSGPTIQSSRGPKQIPVREAYDREFERFLVRLFLERHREAVAKFLDSETAAALPVEARVLASLALDPKTSATRVAKLLPQLDRAPNDEELLRLAQFPEEPGVGEALKALLAQPKSGAVVAEKLLAKRTLLDAARVAPILKETALSMLKSDDLATRKQALVLCSGFQIPAEENVIEPLAQRQQQVFAGQPVPPDESGELALRLAALAAIRSPETQLFYVLAESDPDATLRDAALDALIAASTNSVQSACERLFKLYPKLTPTQRKRTLNALSGQAEGGAKSLLTAILGKTIPQADLDGPVLERLATVLGEDPALAQLQQQFGGVFGEVLLLDGQDSAWVDSKLTLEGPFTVETWLRLTEGIGNQDSILGSPKQIDLNFFGSKFRVWLGDGIGDVAVAQKPMTPDLWTHVAITRDADGVFRLYQNGELEATSSKKSTAPFKDCRIGWSGPNQGTHGALSEFRVWKQARTEAQIRAHFDRILPPATEGLHFAAARDLKPATPKLYGQGARIAKTLDTPPLLTEAQAQKLDAQFTRYTALAAQGKPQNGQPLAALCLACHQIGSTGGQIGPNLSGAGAMGLEAVLRNILTPNAAMEPGYRIFRLEMVNGDLLDAFYVSEDAQAYVVRQPGLTDRRVPKKDVRTTRHIRRSLMPEGLLDALNDQQAADLLAYLMTLKG